MNGIGLKRTADQKNKYQWGPKNTQALNRYSYVRNNPLRYIDPTGHFDETMPGGYGGSRGGGIGPVGVFQAVVVWGSTHIISQFLVKTIGTYLAAKSFKPGKQGDRDKKWGVGTKAFWDWWHRVGKDWSGDITSKKDAEREYRDWLDQGSSRASKGDR